MQGRRQPGSQSILPWPSLVCHALPARISSNVVERSVVRCVGSEIDRVYEIVVGKAVVDVLRSIALPLRACLDGIGLTHYVERLNSGVVQRPASTETSSVGSGFSGSTRGVCSPFKFPKVTQNPSGGSIFPRLVEHLPGFDTINATLVFSSRNTASCGHTTSAS